MISRRCIVSGRVQGVWFRGTTRDQAQRLGIHGTAVNRADGTVEVLMRGEAEAVEQLCQWLHQGPTAAQVSAVSCTDYTGNINDGFTTG